jgi:2-desacetyl-2-hydroxyethyl bacteriochlorophyllide A dehydrogenase
MKAVVVSEPGDVRVQDVSEPQVGPKDVQVQVGACGICGTDIHIIDGEFPPTHYPIIIGHEFGGTVTAVGNEVIDFSVGDRVGIDPTLNCGECYFCQRGKGNLCERWNAVGVGHHPGGFAEYVAVPERCAYHLPDGMSFAEAALIEPVSCVVHGFHLLAPQPGDSYLVYGAGPMGLQNAQVARYYGASHVAIVDINPSRLEIARSFGFDLVGASIDEVHHAAPRGFDVVIEATGRTKVAELAINGVIRGGKLLIFGVCPPGEKAAYDAFKIFNDEISIIGSMAVSRSYGPAISVIKAGALDTKRMVSHSFPMDRFDEAVATMRAGVGLKIQVDPRA